MPRKAPASADEFTAAVNVIEANTCYRLTAKTDDGSGFFVPVADGQALGSAFYIGRARILALARVKKPKKRR